jgi:transcriptional regulator with XRE-family HTH domain
MTERTVSDLVAERVREARRARGWQIADLAARCAGMGHPELTENVIENIEHGRRDKTGRRRRNITIDELAVLSLALGFDASAVHFAPDEVLTAVYDSGQFEGLTPRELEDVAGVLKIMAADMRRKRGSEG